MQVKHPMQFMACENTKLTYNMKQHFCNVLLTDSQPLANYFAVGRVIIGVSRKGALSVQFHSISGSLLEKMSKVIGSPPLGWHPV